MQKRLLIFSLVALGLLYALKVGLVVVSAPPGPELEAGANGEGRLATSGRAVEPGLLGQGRRAWRNGEDDKALELFQQCIENLEDTSQVAACRTALGELVLTGSGVGYNYSEALRLFEESAAEGDPDAQYNLGILYGATHTAGEDLQRREALAVLHLYAASTAGHPGALMAMGYRHLHGYGVPQACATSALNYINVAKHIASVYSEGMPQAVELIRLNLNQKDRKIISSSEMNLFVQIATGGDTTVAAAIGKRYLLGIEGFKQDYGLAKHYLRMAASRSHAGALALLGYMNCLGLGIARNLDVAYSYFVSAATQHDALGSNGLGYIYFTGTPKQPRDMKLAFHHFNESAFGGSSDGMFNLASMYLTGTGTEQSFTKAVLFYTQALDRGHTPAAYSLAVMHLNGIGTVRDCDIAVNLLKKVCERGEWVSSKLVDAYENSEKYPDRAAIHFLKLAEAGHEVAQMNAAHIFDNGQSSLLSPAEESSDVRHGSRSVAQRYYELSAEQGSASSELRLGDFAYNGWGIAAAFKEDTPAGTESEELTTDEGLELPTLYTSTELELKPQLVDYEAAIARYRKTAEMTVTGEWMQGFVARGSFNLGFMHQFGLGVAQDLQTAKQHYHRCREVDPTGLQMPVTLVLGALGIHMMLLRLPAWDVALERLFADFRVHILVVHLLAVASLALLRQHLAGATRHRGARAPREASGAPPDEGRDR